MIRGSCSNRRLLASIGADQPERDNDGAVESNGTKDGLENVYDQKPSAADLNAESQPTAASRPGRVVLRPKQVQDKTGVKHTMFYRLQNRSDPLFDVEFPLSFSILGGRARGYFEDEIDAWLERQAAKDPRRQRMMPANADAHAFGCREKCKLGDEHE
ncbi:helix-turn-helix transcriptional regulator [Solimonas flava]|uniref:helix-turn-helix transcriptional regulator n=1 Tax=Solimonas flava TaxID=415849 RepID=UPI0013767538|nr:AlpA family phage regulatory protein [Solimonas flava]